MRRLTPRVLGLAGILTLLVAAVLTAAAWWVTGGRWLTIETPSMAQAAPVGTLVLTRPAAVADLAVGDVISFVPPGMTQVYTHRVVDLREGGVVMTRGDANLSADGWVLHQGDIAGRVVARWWGVGWLLKALPLLTVAIAAILLATARFVGETWRKPARLFLVPLAVGLAGLLYKPWVGLVMIDQLGEGSTPTAPVGRLVSTGILPVKAWAHSTPGNAVHLTSGQVGDLALRGPDAKGHVFVDGALDLHGWWWVAVAVACLLPVVYELATMRGDRGDSGDGEEPDEVDVGEGSLAPV